MIRFLADENFRRYVVRGVRRLDTAVDILIAQDAGLTGTPDPDLLAWAAANDRVVLTHDIQSLVGFAYDRVRAGEPMAGVAAVLFPFDRQAVIDCILIAAHCSDQADWTDQVNYLPL